MKFITNLLKPRQPVVPDRIAELEAKRERYAKAHPEAGRDAPSIFAVRARTYDNFHPRLDAFTFLKNYSKHGATEEQVAEMDASAQMWHDVCKGSEAARSQLPSAIYLREDFKFPDPFPSIFVPGTRIFLVSGEVARIMRSHDMGEAALLPVAVHDNAGTTTYDQEVFILAPGTFRPTIKATSPNLHRNRYSKALQFRLPTSEASEFKELIPLEQPQNASSIWWDRIIQWSFFVNEDLVRDLKSTRFEKDAALIKVG